MHHRCLLLAFDYMDSTRVHEKSGTFSHERDFVSLQFYSGTQIMKPSYIIRYNDSMWSMLLSNFSHFNASIGCS